MSQQGDAFVRRVLKADPAPMSFDNALKYLRQREGSNRAAARLLGKSESSLRRWDKGTTPKPETQQQVMETVRRLRSRPSAMGDEGVILPLVSQDRKRTRRERDVSGRQIKLRPGTLKKAHDVWVKTGDADAAAVAFASGIGEPWYRTQMVKGFRREGVAGAEDVSYDLDYDIDDDYGMSIG